MKAMHRDPGKRYGSAGALKEEVTSFLENRTLRAPSYNPVQLIWKWMKRNRRMLQGAFVAMVLVSMAAYGIFQWIQHRQVREQVARVESLQESFQEIESLVERGKFKEAEQ